MYNGHMKNPMWLKDKCPRCGGNLYLEREEYGKPAGKCLLCARTVKLPENPVSRAVNSAAGAAGS
jgi:reverse gyrase